MALLKFFTRLTLIIGCISLLLAVAASWVGSRLPPSQWIPLSLHTEYEGGVNRAYLFDVGHDVLAYLNGKTGGLQPPALSPDERTVAYFTADTNDYVMKLDTIPMGNPVSAIKVNYGTSPAWSPDGRQIAFQNGSSNVDIYVVNLNDYTTRRMTNNPLADEAPAWSPDGNWIAYDGRSTYSSGLYLIDAHCPADCDSKVISLTDNGAAYSPVWSPDGRQMAYLSTHMIFLLDMTCLDRTVPCTQEKPSGILQSNPSILWIIWSADGQQIFFETEPHGFPVLNAVSASCRGEPTCQPVPLVTVDPPPGLRW